MDRNLCFLVSLILAFCYGFGQELPPVACPDNFAYLKVDDRYVGQVSMVLNGSDNTVTVELTGRGVGAVKSVGEIKLSDSVPTVEEKLQKKEKINMQMDLNATDVLPKLLKITVNGEIICQGVPYDPPFSLAIRTLGLHTKKSLKAEDKAEDTLDSN